MKVLITGGAGFIGSCLAKKLLAMGDQVTIVDNLCTGDRANVPAGADFLEADICDINWDDGYLNVHPSKFDEVYHLAAVVGVRRVLENPLETLRTNLEGTHRLLEAVVHTKDSNQRLIKAAKKPHVFIASTSEVYGKNDKRTLTEEDDRVTGSALKHRWVYAETKAMDEFLASIYSHTHGAFIMVGRFFSIVGPGQKSSYGMVIPKFVEQALAGTPITVYGDGAQIRSFMHVNDCVDSMLDLMRGDYVRAGYLKRNAIVNIGNPEPIMIKDLAYRVKNIVGSDKGIVYVPYDKAYGAGFEDMMHRVPDISLLTQVRGGDVKFQDLDSIIKDCVARQRGSNVRA